jgi:hypothetical protein
MRYSRGFNIQLELGGKQETRSGKTSSHIKKRLENPQKTDSLTRITSFIPASEVPELAIAPAINTGSAHNKSTGIFSPVIKTKKKHAHIWKSPEKTSMNQDTEPAGKDSEVDTDTRIGIGFALAGILSVILAFIFAVYYPIFIFTFILGAAGLLFSIFGLSGVTQDDTKAIIRGFVAVLLSVAALIGGLFMVAAYSIKI